jgi:hypothetical protein
MAMFFLIASFGSAITCLRHDKAEFDTLRDTAYCLFAITVGLYEGDYRELQHQPWLLTMVLLFLTLSAILLINLLIAQLNCSYDFVYQDSVGFARLARAELIVDTLASCPQARWRRYVSTLRFDSALEFDEGDVGLSGGIQVKESASLNPVVADSIQRFGGSCSADMQWPEHEEKEDRFERVERLMQRTLKAASMAERQNGMMGAGDSRGDSKGYDDSKLSDGSSVGSSGGSSVGSDDGDAGDGFTRMVSPTSPESGTSRKSERAATIVRKSDRVNTMKAARPTA